MQKKTEKSGDSADCLWGKIPEPNILAEKTLHSMPCLSLEFFVRLRLHTRLTLINAIILITLMAFFAFFSINALEKVWFAEAVKDIDNLSETILRTTHHQMLSDDRPRVYQTISEVGQQPGVRYVRLVNKDGEIRYSTRVDEIGTQVDKRAPACIMCHGAPQSAPLVAASSMSRSHQFTDMDGEKFLGMARAIYNQPTCSTAACHFHSAQEQLLGVLDVAVSLTEMSTLVRTFKQQMILSTFGLLAALSLGLFFVTRRFIQRPIADLLVHTQRLARGDLSGRIEAARHDELGELEESFNEMTAHLQLAQDELYLLASSLETKVEERTRALQQMQSQLVRSEKLASLGELVAGIAHEINNPLTGILVFANLLNEDGRLHPDLRADLAVIQRETQRCSAIVQRLLAFSREAPPQKKRVDLHLLLDNTLQLLEKQPNFRNIELIRSYAPELPAIEVDEGQISQVFMNILLNAVQAMPDGGPLKVQTQQVAGERVEIVIADRGCGLDEAQLARIFDPFYTTKPTGTGLGLSVSYGIIESHGGSIRVESKVAQGTEIRIELPIAAASRPVESSHAADA